jgi:16S rRNA (cytosine967-C5)-methyltransferase
MSVNISPARAAAFRILCGVAEGAHSDDLLFSPAVTALSDADKNLTMAIVMGVLRWQILLDAQIAALMDRPLLKVATEVMVALRMGVFQLWYLDRIPDHAAISESVELCRAANQAYATGMVNAVLRKLARAGKPAAQTRKLVVTPAFLAAEYAHPEWMVARWMKIYGAAVTEKILAADQSESQVGAEMFVEADGPPGGSKIDAGSRLVAEIAAAGAAKNILDCCAAPGGKTMVLAERHPEAEITAMDNSAPRLERMRGQLRAFANVECVPGDAAKLGGATYDRILCDVPCSGTGTLARNPEIRHKITAADLSKQAKRQREILASTLRALKPGGRLIYSTCSLEPEENEQIVEFVLGKVTGARLVPMAEVLENVPALTADAVAMLQATAVRGDLLRTVPGVQPCDGFFAAVITKD